MTQAIERREVIGGYVAGAIAVIIWGGYLAYSRAGVLQAGLLAADFALLRFVPAGLALLPILVKERKRGGWAGIPLSQVAALTLFGGPLFICAATGGYYFAPLSHGVAIQPSSAVLGGLLLTMWILRVRLRKSHWWGAAVILFGPRGSV